MSNPEVQRWTLKVDGEGYMTIPEDVLNELGWKVDDVLEWSENDDGSFTLRKVVVDHE